MPGYLDTYGVGEERRGRKIKQLMTRVVLPVLVVALLGTCAFLYFRTWRQEQTVKRFFATLENKDFQGAYKMWCPTESSCKYNPFEMFEADWGPATPYAHGSADKIDNVDYCGDTVVFNVSSPNAEARVLVVDRGTGTIGYAPSDWDRCPGPHWQFRRFFKSLFSS